MTKDTLDRANAINNRLGKVNAWLDGLDETDPSGIDTQLRAFIIAQVRGYKQQLERLLEEL